MEIIWEGTTSCVPQAVPTTHGYQLASAFNRRRPEELVHRPVSGFAGGGSFVAGGTLPSESPVGAVGLLGVNANGWSAAGAGHGVSRAISRTLSNLLVTGRESVSYRGVREGGQRKPPS